MVPKSVKVVDQFKQRKHLTPKKKTEKENEASDKRVGRALLILLSI